MDFLQLVSFLFNSLIPFVTGLVGAFAFYFFVRTKKKGFALLGAAFVMQAAGTVVYYYLLLPASVVSPYIGGSPSQPFVFLGSYLLGIALFFVVAVLFGLLLLYKEIVPNL